MRSRVSTSVRRILAVTATAVAVLGTLSGPAAVAEPPEAPLPPRLLYVTNSGMAIPGIPEGGPHDTTMFTISPAGTLTPFGTPVPGVFLPRGIVFSPNGHSAYIADSGADLIAPYRVGADGTLTVLQPPVPTGDLPFGIAMAPNGRTLYTANFNSSDVSAFAVADDGTISQLAPPVKTGHSIGKGVAITPDGRFLYVAHGTPVDHDPDVVVRFDIRPDGTLSEPGPATPIGVSGAGLVVTPDGRFLYVACQGSDEIWGFRIGQNGDLTLLPGMPVLAADFTEGAAVAPDGRHLYVTALGNEHPDQDGVYAFTIEADGTLTQLGERIPAGDGPGAASPTADGRFVYISNFRSDELSVFQVLPSGGLEEIASSPYLSGGEGPAFGAVMVAPNHGPVASFTAAAHTAGRTTWFDASASTDSDGRIVRYDWDFGDGTRRTNAGPRPGHGYRYPGTYQVTVTVTDNEGCSTRYITFGQSALCTGSALAHHTRMITIP